MTIGLCTLELHLPGCRSLKEKRMLLNRLRDRLRKLNVGVAEVEYHDLWQRSVFAVVSVSGSAAQLDRQLQGVLQVAEREWGGVLVRAETEHL